MKGLLELMAGAPPVIPRKWEVKDDAMTRTLACLTFGFCLRLGLLALKPAGAQTGAIAVTYECLLDFAEQTGNVQVANELRLIDDLDPGDIFLVHPANGWVINAVCPSPQPLRTAVRPSPRSIVSAPSLG